MRPVWLEEEEREEEMSEEMNSHRQQDGQGHITWILLCGGGSAKPLRHLNKGVECSAYAFTGIALATL